MDPDSNAASGKTQSSPPRPPAPAKPGALTAFGVLNLVFGVIGTCGIGLSALLPYLPQDKSVPNPALELLMQNASYRMYFQVSLGLGFVAVVILIIGGIGLLLARPFGRSLSNAYGVYAIISGIAGMIVSYVLLIQPNLEKVTSDGSDPQVQAALIGGIAGGLLGGCLGEIYPILLLFFINRPKVVAALKRSR